MIVGRDNDDYKGRW